MPSTSSRLLYAGWGRIPIGQKVVAMTGAPLPLNRQEMRAQWQLGQLPCRPLRACYELCEDTAASGEHEAGESDEVQSFQGFRQSFIVPGEATEPGSPGEEPFHNPSTR